MKVFRITKRSYAKDLSGTGAAIFGGRWNRKGTPVLYTGESKEIALLETLVHMQSSLLPKLSLVTIQIPDNSIEKITKDRLPNNWYEYPAPSILAHIGSNWVKNNNSLALKVPSSIIHSSFNYIINCTHKDFNKVKIVDIIDFYFDTRLIKNNL